MALVELDDLVDEVGMGLSEFKQIFDGIELGIPNWARHMALGVKGKRFQGNLETPCK